MTKKIKKSYESIYDEAYPDSETMEQNNLMASLDELRVKWHGEDPPCLATWSDDPETKHLEEDAIIEDPSLIFKAESKMEQCRMDLKTIIKTLNKKKHNF